MLSDRQLTGIISEKLDRALNASDNGISQRRRDLFDRYYGALEGSERDGYSKFTTREVMEAVEWSLPSLIRIFYGSDKVVSFDPEGNDDEAAAAQETEACNYVITKANRGDSFEAVYSFIKDALMSPTAYAKVYAEEEERSFTRRQTEMLPNEVAELAQSDNIELLEQDSRTIDVPIQSQDATGQPVTMMQQVEVFDVTYRETDNRPKMRIIPVPGEEVLVDRDFTALNLDNSPFVAHRVRKNKSELLRMDYDEDELESVSGYGEAAEFNDERTHRLFYEDEHPDGGKDEPDESMAQFWCHECYLWVDYDEDGVSEYRKVFMIGNQVFENEEVDYQPMIAMSSIIVPHKHTGLSVAELVEDQQQLLTTLMRNLLDNAYALARNRKVISENSLIEDGSTMDAILNPVAEYTPVRGDARAAIAYEERPNAIGDLLGVISHSETKTAMRTGVSPENSVDADVLQQAKTGAFMAALDKAGERIELIARVMAETGLKQMFRKVHTLVRTYPDIARTIRLRGSWVPIDPMAWRERTDLTVNIGLGTSNKQQQIPVLAGTVATSGRNCRAARAGNAAADPHDAREARRGGRRGRSAAVFHVARRSALPAARTAAARSCGDVAGEAVRGAVAGCHHGAAAQGRRVATGAGARERQAASRFAVETGRSAAQGAGTRPQGAGIGAQARGNGRESRERARAGRGNGSAGREHRHRQRSEGRARS